MDRAGTMGGDRGAERPAISAESMSTGGRYLVLALTLLASALTIATIVAVFVSPAGLFDLGTPGVFAIGVLLALIWLLQLVFGALLENDRSLPADRHRVWMAAFVLTGPVGMIFYWFLHVRRAPHEEPHA